MNKRLTKNLPKTIGGVLVLIILTCVGLFLYARWDLIPFKEQSKVSSAAAPRTEKVANTNTEESPPAEITAPKSVTQHNVELKSDGLDTETPSLETLDSLIDELALSEVEPSEAETVDVQGGSLEEEVDSGSSLASLISSLEHGNVDIGSGSPEDLATVVEMLKRAAKGPMAVDDLITMIEAWLRIQPDTPHMQSEINETRYTLTNMLSGLRAEKEKSRQSGKEIKYPFRIY
jgi:hypothetical protein